jgi:VanZ family protein
MAGARSSAAPLALAFTALVVYASLYPFVGWSWPPGHELPALMALPWPRYFPHFDLFANLLGYLPLGALIATASLRGGWPLTRSLALAIFGPMLLSYAMEVLQNFVPERVPSRLDWALNSAGATLGALLVALLHASGRLERLRAVRERWFVDGSAGVRALLALWPAALLFPAPVAFGVGQIGEPLRHLAQLAMEGTPWADAAADWLAPASDVPPLTPLSEGLAITLGLLGPCLLAHSALRPGMRRVALAAIIAGAGFATTTLSTALNFGPAHALTWLTPATLPALAAAMLLATFTAWTGRRLAAALALLSLGALLALVAEAPSDPYFAQSLQDWQQGRFIHFHGLAQWVGWLWPYAAIGWLLLSFGARERDAA